MKQFLAAFGLLFLAGTATTGVGGQDQTLERIMQRKLDHAHALLEALILDDFDAMKESAASMRTLSEEAAWFVVETSEYAERSAAFRRALDQIESAAERHNSEGAALGYVDMTLKCVGCHQLLRGSARAELGQDTRNWAIAPSFR